MKKHLALIGLLALVTLLPGPPAFAQTPEVTVSFGEADYKVAEGGTVIVTVELSADPQRTVTIELTTTDEGGATDADYTGVPDDVTFNSGETSTTFTFSATDDTVDDDESVKLGFGTSLPTGVSAG